MNAELREALTEPKQQQSGESKSALARQRRCQQIKRGAKPTIRRMWAGEPTEVLRHGREKRDGVGTLPPGYESRAKVDSTSCRTPASGVAKGWTRKIREYFIRHRGSVCTQAENRNRKPAACIRKRFQRSIPRSVAIFGTLMSARAKTAKTDRPGRRFTRMVCEAARVRGAVPCDRSVR